MQFELEIVPATIALLDLAIARSPRLGEALRAEVVEGWDVFPESLVFARRFHEENPGAEEFGVHFFVSTAKRSLVGYGGFKGAPGGAGEVEIGYGVAPSWRRRGVATEASRLLIAKAFAAGARRVTAHTLAGPGPSVRVLERLGFRKVGELVDPDDGVLYRFALER